MATDTTGFLVEAVTYLGAAAVAVPIFNRFKLGSILGYIAAGVLVGPHGIGQMHQEERVFHIAELGVVLFLFIIGLELSLNRLWSMRGQIIGLGGVQMAVTGAVLAGLFVSAGVMDVGAATIAGLALAFSSTAFALQLLKDRGDLNLDYGRRAFSILLFQDIAVIPVLAALPFVAGVAADSPGAPGWVQLLKAAGVLAVIVIIGRFGMDRLFRVVAGSGSREAFAICTLFMVAVTALAVSWASLSMALGAFLAGVLLSESSYRHQIETDIEPYRGFLLGLFFISIGMRLDIGLILESWQIVLGGALGLILIKSAILYGIGRVIGAGHANALKTATVLSQGGEFAFVVISIGAGDMLFSNNEATLMSAIVTISMMATPVLLMAAHFTTKEETSHIDDIEGMSGPEAAHDHVIVAGFGRMGQIISQVLGNSGVSVTAIDYSPSHIRNAERFGFKVYYGDASRLDVLTTAGAENAKAVILCMDDKEAVKRAVQSLRSAFPTLVILAVAHDRIHEIDLRPLGVDVIVRETLESSIRIARETLFKLGHDEREIEDFVEQFRKRDRERLLAQEDYGPEAGIDIMHTRYERRSKNKNEKTEA